METERAAQRLCAGTPGHGQTLPLAGFRKDRTRDPRIHRAPLHGKPTAPAAEAVTGPRGLRARPVRAPLTGPAPIGPGTPLDDGPSPVGAVRRPV